MCNVLIVSAYLRPVWGSACIGVYTGAGVPQNASGVSRGSAIWTVTRGVPVGRGLYGCWGAKCASSRRIFIAGGFARWESEVQSVKRELSGPFWCKTLSGIFGPHFGQWAINMNDKYTLHCIHL
jgi:hypothetical protein